MISKIKLFIFTILMCCTTSAFAFSWADLWWTPDQQAQRQLKKGDPKTAAQKFENPEWRGVANYRSEQYEQSLKDFSQSNNLIDLYNSGNALAQLGQYEDAISAYEKVLEKNPNDADAKFNRDLLKKLLQQKKPDNKNQNQSSNNKNQQQSQNNSQKDKNDSDKNKSSKDQNQQQSQNNSDKQNDSNQNQPQSNPQQSKDKNQNDTQKDKDNNPSNPEQSKNKDNEKNKDSKQSPESQSEQNKNEQKENPDNQAQPENKQTDEEKKSQEQWLRRVPDDPGGLLRQKFMRDHLKNMGN
ncbi:MAG: tetratricopeptide repeat protein [Proteobacteria bacterium]|nr:tetratricopeptide repeat protein [Pseudomonadota bacterium]